MMRNLRLINFIGIIALLSCVRGLAQNVAPAGLEIAGEYVMMPANARQWFDSTAQNPVTGAAQMLVQFHTLPTSEEREQFARGGIVLVNYVSAHTYIALIRFPLEAVAPVSNIRSIVPLQSRWKIDRRIATQLNFKANKRIKVLTSFFRPLPLQDIILILKPLNADISDKRFAHLNTYEIELPQNKIEELSRDPFVLYIGLPAENKPLNFDARSSSGINYLSSPQATGGYMLNGEGVTVGIGDISSGIYHVDVRDRIINFHPLNRHLHGTHTTVTVGGNGLMNPRATGMAPKARILSHIFDLVWAQTPYMYADYNMTVTNNSYAAVVSDCNYAGTYDQYSQMLDELHQDFPFVQHVFASGNDGPMTCAPYPPSYHTVNGGYQPSKNILTVGAMAKDNIIWPKSSRGPVNDGRLKPEIMAYGFNIYSGDVFDTYGGSNGTSMSCPVVAGNLVLIEQRYKQLHGNQNIPSHLLKALAMNGATDVGHPGPDFLHGYGLLNTYRSIEMLNNNRYAMDSVSHGNSKTYTLTVPANTAQLKIMLYWHDAAATPLSVQTLINDLDLEAEEPNGNLHHPLILDPSPANVSNNAVEGIDRTNNSEQIIINNPQAGNYTVRIAGFSVPSGNQQYVIVHDFIPEGIKIKYPAEGNTVPANDSIYIYWDASEDTHTFTLEYSDDNGASWQAIDNNVPASQRHYFWYTPNISSELCLFKISRNNTSQQDVSGTFVMNPAPVVQLSATQCPGYMAIEWTAVPGATAYEVLKKAGDDLQPVDTVAALSYVFSGLSYTDLHYAGIRPLIHGVRGWRSLSVKRIPDDGDCAGAISDNDLALDAIISPRSGRLFTSSALTNNDTLTVSIRNVDDGAQSHYKISYSLNGGVWQSQSFTNNIPAGGIAVYKIAGQNLFAPGVYEYKVAVTNLSNPDPVPANDTLVKFVRQLSNAPVDLNNTFTDDFEGAPLFSILHDSAGILPNEHWDYINSTDSGRIRSFVSSDVLIKGNRSLSMDLSLLRDSNRNYLTGTFNLQNYNVAATEARLEFDYKLHGKPKFLEGNEIWIRGDDTQPWVSIYQFDTTADPGVLQNTGSLSLTNTLIPAGQDFSSSFQVRIGQHDTSVIAMNEYGNGLTIDNFRLYSVKNDVQLLSIESPVRFNCDVDSAELTVRIFNSDNLPQDTVELFYRYDNGALVKDTILFIAAKDTVIHTFTGKLDMTAWGTHYADVWLRAAGDSYLPNDSILNYSFRNQPSIAQFPYLEDFENGEGNWYSEGFNNSWEYGTPNSLRLKNAASGHKVWTTNLTGNYNDNELSYLYSPCFEIAALQNPMLSFSLNANIENCGGTLCDGAYVEYSADGLSWTKLGAQGEGYNWYGSFQVWNDTSTRWRVASIPLPKNMPSLRLRFVMKSDAGAAWDGIAVDDIHIFDLKHPVYNGGLTAATNNVNNGAVDFLSDGKTMAQIVADGDLGSTVVKMFTHTSVLHPVLHQYNLSRNYVVRAAQSVQDSVVVRLFITDEEVVQLINDHSCDTCTKAPDAYRLGITKYSDDNEEKENGSLTDNVAGTYIFIPYTNVKWVPYDNGYYAQITVNSFSEFWFNAALPGKVNGGLQLFPNPVSGSQFHIVWSAVPGTELKLIMYDVLGRKVFQANATGDDFDNDTRIELPELQTGIYTVRCFNGNETKTFKLFITR